MSAADRQRRANHARAAIRLNVRNAMQGAEELEGDMPTPEYIALMEDIARDAGERAARARNADQESKVREADRLIDALLDAQAAYCLSAHDPGDEEREPVDAAREALIEFLTRSAAT